MNITGPSIKDVHS